MGEKDSAPAAFGRNFQSGRPVDTEGKTEEFTMAESSEVRRETTTTTTTDSRNKRLEYAFTSVTLTTALLGTAILAFPEKVAYLAFGNGVLQPGESTKEAMRDAAEQVKKGEIPTISLNPEGFWGIPGYKLDPVYMVELGIIGAALYGASLTAYLLQRAAAANVLNAKVYARLNLGLATWAALSLILSLLSHQYFQRTALMVWGGVLANALAATGPLLMQQNPVNLLCDIAADGRNVHSRRGAIYYAYAAFFFVEGVFILLFPSETLKAATNRVPSQIAVLLWQLVAASAHIIVPVATYNLKTTADTRQLATVTHFMLNSILFIVALVHVVVLSWAALTGNAGPIGPVLLTAWSTAFGYSLYNMPACVESTEPKQD
ncbi:hypothetical protein WJX75_007737 [Coccomyxa subellipsoidea]|uniref:Uncharacterized protein n=1 Tax=Coccomyxa subellipsoidea TaxID=248742 RepID=A0ABR2YFI9_9CHLO